MNTSVPYENMITIVLFLPDDVAGIMSFNLSMATGANLS